MLSRASQALGGSGDRATSSADVVKRIHNVALAR